MTGGHFGVDIPARLRTWMRRDCRSSSLHRHTSPCRGALDFLGECRRVPCKLSSPNARGRRSSARIKTFSLMFAAKEAPHHDVLRAKKADNGLRTGAWEQRYARKREVRRAPGELGCKAIASTLCSEPESIRKAMNQYILLR